MRRLYAGTINYHPPEDGWEHIHIDLSGRDIWDRERGPVPVDLVMDVADMSYFADDTFDEVVSHHVLEHVPPPRAPLAVAEAFRVLVPGGVYDIEVPDIDRVARAWCQGELYLPELRQWLYGEVLPNHEPGDSHQTGYTEISLRALLEEAGFEVPSPEATGLAVRFRAVKPS